MCDLKKNKSRKIGAEGWNYDFVQIGDNRVFGTVDFHGRTRAVVQEGDRLIELLQPPRESVDINAISIGENGQLLGQYHAEDNRIIPVVWDKKVE